MRSEKLLFALGQISDDIIEEAADAARPAYVKTLTTDNRIIKPRRRIAIGIAATLILILGSFVTAMAVSGNFREAVFSFFHISTPDIVLPIEDEPEQSGIVENIYTADIDAAVNIEYIRIDGKFDFGNGIIYLYKDAEKRSVDFYAAEGGQLIALETNHVDTQYTWHGITYEIRFDWCISGGTIGAYGRYKESANDAYWVVTPVEGRTDMVLLTLSTGRQNDYTERTLFFYLGSETVADPFEGCGVDGLSGIVNTTFSPDMTKALLSCENGETIWYCNMSTKELMTVDALLDQKVDGSFFLDDNTIGYYAMNSSYRFTYYVKSLTTGAERQIIQNVPMFGSGGSTWGIKPTENRYMLFISEEQYVYVIDLQTGEHMVVDGFVYSIDGASKTYPNHDGSKILFVSMDNAATSLGVSQIGVLDLERRTFTLLNREGYEARHEATVSWFDDNRVVIWAVTDDYGYLYLYSMR